MAVVFQKDFNANELLTTRNPWTVEFNSDNTEAPTKAEVTYEGETFTVDPNPSGSFFYSLTKSINSILNTDNYLDKYTPDFSDTPAYAVNNEGYYKKYSVVYRIYFDGSPTETTTREYRFKKASYSLLDYKLGKVNKEPLFDLLHPSVDGEYYFRTTASQPFCFSVYNQFARSVQIENLTTSGSGVISFVEGVTRVFMQDGLGENITNFNLQNGFNRISIQVSGIADPYILNIYREPEDCSIVLKWFNLDSGWEYYPFIYKIEDFASKSKDFVNRTHENLGEIEKDLLPTGYDLASEIELTAIQISVNEAAKLKSLISSPSVYQLFTKEDGTVYWKPRKFRSGDARLKETRKRVFDFQIKFFEIENALIL